MCFQKLPKLPPLLRDSGNFSNFWKHTWYSSLIFLAPMRLPITIVLNLCSEKLSAQSKKIIQILFIFHAALYRAQLRRRAFSTRYDLVHQLVFLKMRLVNQKKIDHHLLPGIIPCVQVSKRDHVLSQYAKFLSGVPKMIPAHIQML